MFSPQGILRLSSQPLQAPVNLTDQEQTRRQQEINQWRSQINNNDTINPLMLAEAADSFINYQGNNYPLIGHEKNLIHLANYLTQAYKPGEDNLEQIKTTFFNNLDTVAQRTNDNLAAIQRTFNLHESTLMKCELPSPSDEYSVSETHNNLQQVCFLSFSNGSRVCYKPRDMRGEAAIFGSGETSYLSRWNQLLLAQDPSGTLKLATIHYVTPENSDFGFMEFVDDRTVDLATQNNNVKELTFKNIGILEEICRHHHIIDLHLDNVMTIIINEQFIPVIIDGEIYENIFNNKTKENKDKLIGEIKKLINDNEKFIADLKQDLQQQCLQIQKQINQAVVIPENILEFIENLRILNLEEDFEEKIDSLEDLVIRYQSLMDEKTSLLNRRSGYVGSRLLNGTGWRATENLEEAFKKGMQIARNIINESHLINPLTSMIPSDCKRRCFLVNTGSLVDFNTHFTSSTEAQEAKISKYARKLKEKIESDHPQLPFILNEESIKRALHSIKLPIDIPVFYLSPDNRRLYMGEIQINE